MLTTVPFFSVLATEIFHIIGENIFSNAGVFIKARNILTKQTGQIIANVNKCIIWQPGKVSDRLTYRYCPARGLTSAPALR